MNDYNIHFLANAPCSIYISGQFIGSIDNVNNFFIDIISYSQNLIITAEPLNGDYVIKSFKLSKIKNNLLTTTNEIDVVPFPENNFDVVINFAKFNANTPNLTVFSTQIKKNNVLVTNSVNSAINIFNNTTTLFSCTAPIINDISCVEIKENIVLTGYTSNGTYLLIFNLSDNINIVNKEFLKVEIENNNVKALYPLNDFYKHGIVYNYDLENNKTTNFSVYLQNKNKEVESELIPFAFLENIKAKDFVTAKSLLSNNLSNSSSDKLEQYFGDIKKIYFNNYFFKPNQLNYTILSKEYKNFTFTLINDLIDEIDEVNIL